MSRDASDSILKILEEPPKDTFFIMSSNFIHQIPSTIRSRSIEIKIKTPSYNECHNWLSESYSENIELAIELSTGNIVGIKLFLPPNKIERLRFFAPSVPPVKGASK